MQGAAGHREDHQPDREGGSEDPEEGGCQEGVGCQGRIIIYFCPL